MRTAQERRMRVEKSIARLLVKKLLKKSLLIGIWDWVDGAMIAMQCANSKSILDDIFSIETPLLRVYDMQGKSVGSVMLVLGNGQDIISDYSESMEGDCREVWERFEGVM